MPFEVIDVDFAVAVGVVCKGEYFAFHACLVCVKERIGRLEKRGLPVGFVLFAFDGVIGKLKTGWGRRIKTTFMQFKQSRHLHIPIT